MHIEHRQQRSSDEYASTGAERSDSAIGAGSLVVLRSPRSLRGTTAIVRREVPGGWEVEVRSPAGTPLHLVVPEKALTV